MIPPSPPHVIVLDGSPLYALVHGRLFTSDGYRVTTLTNCGIDPEEVLLLVPDLIVIDLLCAGAVGGLTFLRRLRNLPGGGDVPVVASTPASRIHDERFMVEFGVLGVAVFDGFGFYDDLLVAARAATTQVHETRKRTRTSDDGCVTVQR